MPEYQCAQCSYCCGSEVAWRRHAKKFNDEHKLAEGGPALSAVPPPDRREMPMPDDDFDFGGMGMPDLKQFRPSELKELLREMGIPQSKIAACVEKSELVALAEQMFQGLSMGGPMGGAPFPMGGAPPGFGGDFGGPPPRQSGKKGKAASSAGPPPPGMGGPVKVTPVKKVEIKSSSIHKAAKKGDLAEVEGALPNVKNIDELDDFGMTALAWAAEGGHLVVMERLIGAGACVDGVQPEDDEDDVRPPLHGAVSKQKKEAAELLLSKGASPNCAETTLGQTCLHVAVDQNKMDFAEMLVAKGADVNAKDGSGHTPVHTAAMKGNMPMLEFLFKKSPDVNAVSETHASALTLAIRKNFDEVALYLLDHDAKVDAYSFYAAMGAKSSSLLDTMTSKHGADINTVGADGRAPIHLAAKDGDAARVKEMLGHKANARVSDKKSKTPLMLASEGGHADVVKALIPHSDIDKQDNDGNTCLHLAGRDGHKDAYIALKEAGANDEILNKKGRAAKVSEGQCCVM